MLYQIVGSSLFRMWNNSYKSTGGYKASHIRATLIGQNEYTNTTYAGSTNQTEDTCLYNYIEDGLKYNIVAKRVKCAEGDVFDKIWLLSGREIDNAFSLKIEGTGSESNETYQKFTDSQSLSYRNMLNLYDECGRTQGGIWLRTTSTYDSYVYAIVYDKDTKRRRYNSTMPPNSTCGIAFGFCLE